MHTLSEIGEELYKQANKKINSIQRYTMRWCTANTDIVENEAEFFHSSLSMINNKNSTKSKTLEMDHLDIFNKGVSFL